MYDVTGREVKVLADNEHFGQGIHELNFDGSGLASGVYFYHLYSFDGKFNEVKKMVLLK